jgi:subtilase family serine protease
MMHRASSWVHRLFRGARRPTLKSAHRVKLRLEQLEDRTTPSAGFASPTFQTYWLNPPSADGAQPYAGSATPHGHTPAEIRHAYGVDAISFGGITGDGSGQVVGIIDAYDNPTFLSSTNANYANSDLHKFNVAMGLADPYFRKVGQTGSETSLPGTDPAGPGGWGVEEALDVEWVHAIAPAAQIILVECNSNSYANLFAGVAEAKTLGATVISMSFGGGEFSGETGFDSTFTGAGVSFVASTGDNGAPGGYPSWSPNVIAVGGTGLTLGSGNTYGSESGWSGSGGGKSVYESRPAYQNGVQSVVGTQRGIPDISFLADPSSGVAVLSSYDFGASTPWLNGFEGGTSLAAPCIAALISIANEGRAAAGLGTLSGSSILSSIYSLSASDYHDITTGNNGFAALVGYDLVTGMGTPIANKWVVDLSGYNSATSSPTYTVAQFSGYGVWRYNDSTGWQQLTGAGAYLVGVDSAGDVVGSFSNGTWLFDHSSGWMQLTGANPYSLDIATGNGNYASGALVAGSYGNGVWSWAASKGWVQLGTTVANQVAINTWGDVVADYYYYGVWRWIQNSSSGSWSQLTGAYAYSVDISAIGGTTVVAASFSNGVWKHTNAGGWVQLGTAAANSVAVDASGDVAADYYYYGVWKYTNSSTSWAQITAAYGNSVDIASDGTIVGGFSNGVWRYTTGWRQLTSSYGTMVGVG